MTATELTRYQLDDSAYQVEKVFDGVSEEAANIKVNEHCMSPRECLAHLVECCLAFVAVQQGKEHAWGSFVPEDSSMDALRQSHSEKRAEVRHIVQEAGDDEKTLKAAAAYITAHDYYHVGQMATFRLTNSPGWDPYSIYSHG